MTSGQIGSTHDAQSVQAQRAAPGEVMERASELERTDLASIEARSSQANAAALLNVGPRSKQVGLDTAQPQSWQG